MLTGIHTALLTPFREDGRLDLDTFTRQCERQREAGVHGLVVCGTTGESPTLDAGEQAALLEAARAVAGSLPVMMGVGTNDTRSTVDRVERALHGGASAGLLVLPYYNKPNAEGLRRHVGAAAAVGLPLVLYHVPGRTGQRVEPGALARLTEVAGVVAVKEATGDLRYGNDLLAALRPEVAVLSGDDFTFLGSLAQGAHGCISVLSNVAPRETVQIYEDHRAGRVAAAAAELGRLWPLVTWLFAETNPVPAKAAMAALGLGRAEVRLPLAAWAGPSPRELLTRLGIER